MLPINILQQTKTFNKIQNNGAGHALNLDECYVKDASRNLLRQVNHLLETDNSYDLRILKVMFESWVNQGYITKKTYRDVKQFITDSDTLDIDLAIELEEYFE